MPWAAIVTFNTVRHSYNGSFGGRLSIFTAND